MVARPLCCPAFSALRFETRAENDTNLGMKTRTVTKDPSEIVGRIYDAAFESGYWPGLLCDIADLCGAGNAALVVSDPRINYSTVITPRADPGLISAYGEYWWQHDPTSAATAHVAAGHLTTLANTGRERFFRSKFYNEFWRFSGFGAERIATNLLVDGGAFASCVLHTSNARDEVGNDTHALFKPFVPHLIRAVEVNRKLHHLELKDSIANIRRAPSHAGTIMVDAGMRLVYADAAAEEMFRSGSMVSNDHGIIGLRDSKANASLHEAVTACAQIGFKRPAGGRLQTRVDAHRAPLVIEVLPYRMKADSLCTSSPVAMLLVTDPDQVRTANIERLCEHFGLTRAEAALSLEIMKGDGRAAAAERCGISINTARTHLTRVFDKTGVNRQAELIRVLLSVVE